MSKFKIGDVVIPIAPSRRDEFPTFVRSMERWVDRPSVISSVRSTITVSDFSHKVKASTIVYVYILLQGGGYDWNEKWLVKEDVRLPVPSLKRAKVSK